MERSAPEALRSLRTSSGAGSLRACLEGVQDGSLGQPHSGAPEEGGGQPQPTEPDSR